MRKYLRSQLKGYIKNFGKILIANAIHIINTYQ